MRVKPNKHGQKQREICFFVYKGYNHNTLLLFKKDPDSKAEGIPPASLLDVKRESSVIQMPSNSQDYPSFHSSFSIREPE
ncbi:MAG: hypothetical protein ACI4NB_11990 [Candidatus Ornithospirochaeta sp.]